jgi:hypothetical protein
MPPGDEYLTDLPKGFRVQYKPVGLGIAANRGSILTLLMRVHGPRDAYSQASKTKTNSVVLVREQTIPTERPPLVGEVSANLQIKGVALSAQRISTDVFSVF